MKLLVIRSIVSDIKIDILIEDHGHYLVIDIPKNVNGEIAYTRIKVTEPANVAAIREMAESFYD